MLIDTNILIHAVNSASPDHSKAARFLEVRLKSHDQLHFTWGTIYEFLRVSTHPRVLEKPLSAAQALDFLRTLLRSGHCSVLVPGKGHFQALSAILSEHPELSGNIFHDVETAALLREHAITQIATADTDFLRFDFLQVTNPLRP